MFGNLFNKKAAAASATAAFAGRWTTTFGAMELRQQEDEVHGTYLYQGQECELHGRIRDGQLRFTYQEPAARGEGWFALVRPGRFEGQWRQDGQERWLTWIGERGFEGIWDSSFGLLRLVQDGDHVAGFYEGLGSSTVDGQVRGNQLAFRYQEPQAAGEGQFTLADHGLSFEGHWRPEGATMWQPWQGHRLGPTPGQTWLVVIEAHWQRHLMDKEYSFGEMLRAFFARVPGVQFSHRFFSNEAGLRQWCRDLMYIPDPVVVVLAAHGTAAGLSVHGKTMEPHALSESLRHADNVKLLHFSSCLTMQDGPLTSELGATLRFPFSGYTTSVDWAASAIAEFTYLDMILSKGLSPEEAAAQLPQLLSFAGEQAIDGSAYPAAGFRMKLPD